MDKDFCVHDAENSKKKAVRNINLFSLGMAVCVGSTHGSVCRQYVTQVAEAKGCQDGLAGKGTSSQSEDLSSSPRTHLVEEDNQLPQVQRPQKSPEFYIYTDTHMCVHTHYVKKSNKISKTASIQK